MFNHAENKIIWIDLDEVLAGTFSLMLEETKSKWVIKNLTFEDLSDHYWDNIPWVEIWRDELFKIWHDFLGSPENIKHIPLVEWSKKWIEKLKDSWYNLHIITARHNKIEETTKIWINNHFWDFFENIHFVNDNSTESKPKYVICQNIWASLMIEDNLDYALDLANNWIACFLLEKPWNKHRTEVHPKIKKVKNWEEITKNL